MRQRGTAQRRPSIATRLAIGATTVAFCVLLPVGGLLQWTLAREVARARDSDIDSKADIVQHFIDEMTASDDLEALRHHLDDVLIGSANVRVWLVADGGTTLYGGKARPRFEAGGDGRWTIWREDGVPLTGKRSRTAPTPLMPAAELLIGVDTRDADNLLARFRNTMVALLAAALLLVAGLVTWVTRKELGAVRRLSVEAAAIAPDALSRRLDSRGVAAELHVLVQSFNQTLDRLQAAYEDLEGFSANVAHELRTPLATMISGAEVTLSRSRSAEEFAETLASNLEELRSLAAMVNDMLFLAQADRGEKRYSLHRIDLAEQALQVVEYFDATLAERRQTATVVGAATTLANPALVRRALVNLMSNAVRYAPEGATLTVKLASMGNSARVSVLNRGSPIDPALLPRLFERFVRGDTARQRHGENHGLGLAIVRAVARLHGGETFVTCEAGFTEVGLTLVAPDEDVNDPGEIGRLQVDPSP